MKKYYADQRVLLRKNMKLGQIVKSLKKDNKYVVSYYEGSVLKYDIVTELDIIDDKEYEIIRKRINLINKILDS